MPTIKLKFRPSRYEGREGCIYFQVTHNRIVRRRNTKFKIFPNEWDANRGEILLPPLAGSVRREYLRQAKESTSAELAHLQKELYKLLLANKTPPPEELHRILHEHSESPGFLGFTHHLIAQLKQAGKSRTAETYTTALNSFSRFLKNQDIPLQAVDSHLMMAYEGRLKSTGICPNTSSFYMRNLRAIYNRAVEQELTQQRFPFKHVYTGIDQTVKRAVPLKIIRQLKDLDLTSSPLLDYARDMFMFSFYTRGMSFIDMAFLKKKDLQNGILSYRRQKTRQRLTINWEKPMQEIVRKYDTGESIYLLPIIRTTDKDERRQYLSAAHLINEKLKKMGKKLNIGIPLTTYVARHAWASIAKSKNIPLSIISEAMGHNSEATTRIYLASLDTSVVDKANKIILQSLG